MTLYNNGHHDPSLPKEINGVHIVQKHGSKKGGFSRKRSMSASSQNSQRSFKATRKRPSFGMENGGLTDIELSKFRPNGAKFLKEIRRPKAGVKLQQLNADLSSAHHLLP